MRNSKIDNINSRRGCHCCCNRKCGRNDSSSQFNYGSKDERSVVALLAHSMLFLFPLSSLEIPHFILFGRFIYYYFFSIHAPRRLCSSEAGRYVLLILYMYAFAVHQCVVCWKMTTAFVKLAGDAECRIFSGRRIIVASTSSSMFFYLFCHYHLQAISFWCDDSNEQWSRNVQRYAGWSAVGRRFTSTGMNDGLLTNKPRNK